MPDIRKALGLAPETADLLFQDDDSLDLELWDEERGAVFGGRNFADDADAGLQLRFDDDEE